MLEPGSEFETAVRAAHRRVHGKEPAEVIMPAVTDCRFYGRYYGIPSLCYGAVGSGSHGFDESVDLDSIKRQAKRAAILMMRSSVISRRAGWP